MINRRTPSPSAIHGETRQSFPAQDIAALQVTEEIPVHPQDYTPVEIGTVHPDAERAQLDPAPVLIWQGPSPVQSDPPQIRQVYMRLPGPWIPFTDFDNDLGNIHGMRRAVLSQAQATSVAAASKTTYQAAVLDVPSSILSQGVGQEASSAVLWELKESWDTSSFPLYKEHLRDDDRGNVFKTTQATTDTTTEASLGIVGGTTARLIRYEPIPGNTNVRKKIIETWTVPGPLQESTEFEKDGVKKVVTRQQMKVADIVTDESLATAILTRKFKERDNEVLAFQIIETITVDDGDLLDLPSFTTSIPNLIPEIFRAFIPTHVESHIVEGFAEETVLELGEFEHSERQLTPLYKEVRSTILDDIGALPIVVTGMKETNDKKQVVSVTMTLELDSTTPTVPTATRDVDFKKLGNELAVEIVRTVPDVFPEDSYTTSILNLIPEKFRGAIPLKESTIDSAGSPSTNPTLLTGEFSRTEGRLTAFTKRVRITSLGTISLPVTLEDTETNEQKQTVAVIHTLDLVGSSTAVPTAVIDVSVTDLGNGYEVETQRTIADIFDPASYTTSIPNLIPEQFRAQIPLRTEIHFVEGIAGEPVLGTGEFSRTEKQINEFVKEERVEVLDDIDALPITITGQKETNQFKQVVTVAMKLCADSTTPTVPTALIDVDFKKLGNGLAIEITKTIPSVFDPAVFEKRREDTVPERFKASVPAITTKHILSGTASAPTLATGDLFRSEKQLDVFTYELTITNRNIASLPTLEGQTYDESLDIIIPYTEEVLAAGTATGDPHTEVTPLGGGLELAKTYDMSAIEAAFADFELVFPGKANLDLPDVLADLELVNEEHAGSGDASTPYFFGAWAGHGSYSVNPNASTQASQVVMPELIPEIVPTNGNNKNTTRCVFLLPMPVSEADVLAKLSAMLGISVVDWPDFNPAPIHAILVGRQVSLKVDASYQIHSGGSDTGDENSEAFNRGYSEEVGMTVKTKEIPACIHAEFFPGDPSAYEYDPTPISLTADAYYGDESRTVDPLPTGFKIKGNAATPGDITIPATGVRLLRSDGSVYRYNHAMFHAEVFNFANL